jgi:hypothetical protein
MFEEIKEIYTELSTYIDLVYLVCFMSITYLTKDLMSDTIIYITKKDLSKDRLFKALTVLFIGTLVALPFWFYFEHDKLKLFITYCVGTSFHEIIIKSLLSIITKITKSK